MTCQNCGMDIPVGSGFCPNCGNMVSMMENQGTYNVYENSEYYGVDGQVVQQGSPNKNLLKYVGLALIFILLISGIIWGIAKIVKNVNGESSSTQNSSRMDAEEAILGYWESDSRVRVDAMFRNILEENDIPDTVIDLLLKAIDLSDERVELALQFNDDGTVRLAINGNMIGDKDLLTYEVLGKSRVIIRCPSKSLLDFSDFKFSFKGFGVEGIDADIKTTEISHTFEYSIDGDEMEIKIFDEMVTLEKTE